MSPRKGGLGRNNLNVFLSESVNASADPVPVVPSVTQKKTGLTYLPVEKLQRGKYQPRQHIATEKLDELAESIRSQGIIQPIVVRPVSQDQYEIIAGERRWRAAQLAGLDKVPVVIKEIPDEAAMAMALIENIQREDLNPIEEAFALERLIEEFQLTHQEVSEKVGKSRTAVTNLLRILNLNNDVRLMLEQNKLELGHAKVLLALSGPEQSRVAKQIILKGLTVRETEALIKKVLLGVELKPKAQKVDPDIRRFETDISEKLGAKVMLQHGSNNKGKLIIHYNSLDELDGIVDHIQ